MGKKERIGRIVIFTDLDGTLLDATTYSFHAAMPALRLIRDMRVPLVICSSKTRAEIEHYRKRLVNSHPFISENGGAIFIPAGYFPPDIAAGIPYETDNCGKYMIIRLGAKYRDLRIAVAELREEGFEVCGFGDMTGDEIERVTGLGPDEAAMAKLREFDEPFLFEGDAEERERLAVAVKRKGFNITQGIFFHILGDSDKGKAVSILIDMYRRQYGEIETVAMGDSANDLPMLLCVDHPVIVKKTGGNYDTHFDRENFERADGVGPEGWNIAITRLLTMKGKQVFSAR